MPFAAKARIPDPGTPIFELVAAKTMYGGKKVAAGDTIFVFASENDGGVGLVALGIVTASTPIAKIDGVARQTPLISVQVERTALATRSLGRSELKSFTQWDDEKPETELNFKLYRQATNKIVGISALAAKFLETFF